jgi:hypothetical protein
LRFRKTIRAPLAFVFRWCTDYRDDDDRLTDDIYQYRTQILLREPTRIVRVVTGPGAARDRSTEVETITLRPPDQWQAVMFSADEDRNGRYRLRREAPRLTSLEMRFTQSWKVTPSNRARYERLFNRVWDRYVETIEREFDAKIRGTARRAGSRAHPRGAR